MVALGALELLGQARVEVAVVVEAGQLVVHAELLELLPRRRYVVVQPLDAEHRLDARDQLALVERLADVVVGADLEALDPARGVGLDGDQHDRQKALVGHPLEQAAGLEPGEPRHQDVEQHQVDAAARTRSTAS